jgi:glycosyltransferase involved in cell wall biosynthesis
MEHDPSALERPRAKILTVAYPFAPVSADAVGGAEQIAFQIVEALGPDALVIAREDSRISGRLLPVPIANGPLNDERVRRKIYQRVRELIASADADLIHFHGVDFHEYLPSDPTVPALVTLHLPVDWYSLPQRENLHFNCVSESQLRLAPAGFNTSVIPNGIPIPNFRVPPKKRDFVICLGRICEEKGFHFALDAAKDAGLPLVLAGQVYPYEAHELYFRAQILPRLDTARRFIGPIGPRRKNRLLAAARCLVVPSLVNETSSLVAMEAMACGAPVVAFRRGALAQSIQPGCNGLLVDDPGELADAIRNAHLLNPEYCRAFARANFSSAKMIARYFDLYHSILLTTPSPAPVLEEALAPI